MQFFIAQAQRSSTFLKGTPLGQQGTLIDDGADEVRQLVLVVVNTRNMQVTREGACRAGVKDDFAGLAGGVCFGGRKGADHPA